MDEIRLINPIITIAPLFQIMIIEIADIMTTMTTVFGMIPLALGIGQGSEIYKGMAIAVIFGLSFSTLLTLVFIPVLYSSYNSMIGKLDKWRGK